MIRRLLGTIALIPALYITQPLANAEEDVRAEIVNLEERTPRPSLESLIDAEEAKVEYGKYRGNIKTILIPMRHPLNSEIPEESEPKETSHIAQTIKMCSFALKDAGYVDTVILEGITPEHAKKIKNAKNASLTNKKGIMTPTYREYTNLLLGRSWNIVGTPEEQREKSYIELLAQKYELVAWRELQKIEEKGWLDSKEKFETKQKEIESNFQNITEEYMKEVKDYFKKDKHGKNIYEEIVKKRNQGFVRKGQEKLKEGARGTVTIFGASHEQGIRKELDEKKVPYAIIRVKELGAYKEIPEEQKLQEIRRYVVSLDENMAIQLKDKSIKIIPATVPKHKYYKKYILEE